MPSTGYVPFKPGQIKPMPTPNKPAPLSHVVSGGSTNNFVQRAVSSTIAANKPVSGFSFLQGNKNLPAFNAIKR
jgi:hypothetical protein